MMNYRILFTDIDGTLLNNKKTISDDVKDAMQKYTNMGGKIVLSSGRPLESILQVVKNLGLQSPNMYIIAYNGAMVYDIAGQNAIWQKRIPASIVRTVLDTAHEMKIQCHTYTENEVISEYDTPELHKYLEHIKIPYRIESNITDYFASLNDYMPYKLLALTFDDEDALNELSARIHALAGDKVHTFFSSYCYLECCMKEASKGNAVAFLCDYLGVDVTQTVSAGDAANDISMLKATGISYAMLNATEDVKEVAGKITAKTNDEDGILEIFEMMMADEN